MEQAKPWLKLACLDRFDTLFGMYFDFDGVQHLSELMHIHPSELFAYAITGNALT